MVEGKQDINLISIAFVVFSAVCAIAGIRSVLLQMPVTGGVAISAAVISYMASNSAKRRRWFDVVVLSLILYTVVDLVAIAAGR
jgi:4-hydroxybenzoate polyprenyltransferase